MSSPQPERTQVDHTLATQLAAQILNQQMGVSYQKIPDSVSLLHGDGRPLFKVVKSYEVKPYGRINPQDKTSPVLPRNFAWDLKVGMDTASIFSDATFSAGVADEEDAAGLSSIVAYEKYIGALEAISEGNIGEAQKLIIRQSPRILNHLIEKHQRFINSTDEKITHFEAAIEHTDSPDDKARLEEIVFYEQQHKHADEIVLKTIQEIILPLHHKLASALGTELEAGKGGPNR